MADKRNYSWKNYVPDGIANAALKKWHEEMNPDREQDAASPSTLLECPRVVWLKKHKVPFTKEMGWGVKQRLLLGRQLENMIAKQFEHAGILLWHWKDDLVGESVKFEHGEGIDKLTGTPDLLLQYGEAVAISDAKTSRSDSFFYVPIEPEQLWADFFWYKYKLQLTAYFMLCHWNKDWFEANGVEAGDSGWVSLPLPELCHLFSYALDDGIVRRDISWEPTKEDADEVLRLTRRWNRAYQSETMPACTCKEYEGKGILFCPYSLSPSGGNVGTECCHDSLINEVKE